MYKITFIFIGIFLFAIFAETPLSGKVGGMTLGSTESPYKITSDLVVEKGKALTIKAGSILLFKQFTGLQVEGSIIVEGTKENPVVFTSINDGKYNDSATSPPQAFDWNGLTITKNAKNIKMSNFLLSYSVFGLKCQSEDITVINGIFNSNGQFNMTVNGQIQKVLESFPFNFGENKTQKPNEDSFTKKNLPAFFATTGAICGIGTIISAVVFFNARSDYLAETSPAEQKKDRTTITNSLVSTAIFGAATAILIPSAIIIHNKRKIANKTTVFEVYPQFRNGPGLSVAVGF
jgi:hypothetical protein